MTNSSIDVATNASATISEAIGGSVGLNKTNAGTLTLSGTNIYTGATTLSGGVLAVSNDANLGDSTNVLTFAGGTLRLSSGLTSSRTISGSGTIDIGDATTFTSNGTFGMGSVALTNSGTLALAGASNAATGLSFSAPGTVNVTGSALSLPGNITTTNTLGSATISGPPGVNFGSGTRLVAVADGSADVDLLISAPLSGASVINKLGAGTLKLVGNNAGLTGTGTTPASIRQGTSATSSAAPVTGGTIAFDNANALGTGQLQLNGGALRNDAGAKLTIANANGVSLGASDNAATPGGLVLGGSELEFSGPLQQFAPAGTSYAHAITTNNTTTFGGGISASAVVGGSSSGGLLLFGTGKLIFSGAASNTEPVSIGGTSVDGSASSLTVVANNKTSSLGGGAVIIKGGSTLAGSGIVAGPVTVSGNITGGTGGTNTDVAGLLTTGTGILKSSGSYIWKYAGGTPTAGTPGTDWDKLILASLDVSGLSPSAQFTIKGITTSNGGASQPTFVVPAMYSSEQYTIGHVNAGSIPDASLFALDLSGLGLASDQTAVRLAFVATGATGYDIELAATPEPTTAMLFGGGAVSLLAARRKQRVDAGDSAWSSILRVLRSA